MTDSRQQKHLRAIPPVDEVLDHAELADLRRAHPGFPWTRLVRDTIDNYRTTPPGSQSAVDQSDRDSVRSYIISSVIAETSALQSGGQRRVINGTGVILHTNLGRAVTGAGTVAAVQEALARYVSLEIDLGSGIRSKRSISLNRMVSLATGAESAMVVNNNAAAVYIVVNSCSPPGRIIVSRGELVEIGGSFRLPEILKHAASDVIEIGTTNRTYTADYNKVARPGDVLLKVHKSNYAMEGFVCEASVGELAGVARDKQCHVVYDLGSGAVFDYKSAGFGQDVRVQDLFASGVDCVTMSGDKLLGSVQAGLIAGNKIFLDKLRQNPLQRAMRIDKVVIAALQEVFRRYLFDADPVGGVPVLGQVMAGAASLRSRAEAVAARINEELQGSRVVDAVDDDAAVGGGSLSTEKVPAAAVRIVCADESDAVGLARRMRLHSPAVVPRVKGNELRINMGSVLEDEDQELAEATGQVLNESGKIT